MEISREDFEDYEAIREYGITNMFDTNTVVGLSNKLTKEKCFQIMKEYSKLKEKFV